MIRNIDNPFLISGYASPEYFCDRTEETGKLMDALNNGRNITLLAPRRMGKTGLIKNVFYHLGRQSDRGVIYIDIYAAQNLTDFTHRFASAVIGSLDSNFERALSSATRFFRSFRPVLALDPVTGGRSYSFTLDPNQSETTLRECFDYLGQSNKRVVVAIDEFQQIANFPEKGTEALLRSFIQFIPQVRFIFAGSKRHLMAEMFSVPKRPFYNSTQLVPLGKIDREAYYRFAADHLSKIGVGLSRDVFCFVYDLFDGVTWYLQAILNRLYGFRSARQEDVARAISDILEENAYGFGMLLESYPKGCVNLLYALAHEGTVKEINSGAFLNKHNLKGASSVNLSLKKLMRNNLVDHLEDGYKIDDRFFNIWLRKQ